MSEKQAKHTPLPSHLREIHNAWLIVPHDQQWKSNLAESLRDIGGTAQELEVAYGYVRDKLHFESLNK